MYAADFLVDTDGWTATEVGIYTRLLMSEWVNGKLPEEIPRLARIAGIDLGNFLKCWARVVGSKFSKNGSPGFVNQRLELERTKQEKYRELQSLKGKLGGRPSKSRSFSADKAERKPEESSSSSSSSSLGSNSKEQADAPFVLPSKEEMEEASDTMIMNQVENICIQLHKEKIFPEVFAFKNRMLKQKKNVRSILHTLCRAWLKREFEEGPWAYCVKIIGIESAKYNARDYGKTS
jgi:uncharacterized protein YdaU (DUF1376 family)